jgi:hypothetical protein
MSDIQNLGTGGGSIGHLNAAQISNLERRLQENLKNIVKDVTLRQWAVEQILTKVTGDINPKTFMDAVDAIYKFVAAPTAEIKITLD